MFLEIYPSELGRATSRYDRYDPIERELEIGYTFLSRNYWGTTTHYELKKLMINHAFTFVDSILFYVWEKNFRSQRAVQKLGAIEERLFQGPHHKSFEYRLRKTLDNLSFLFKIPFREIETGGTTSEMMSKKLLRKDGAPGGT